MKLLNIFKKVRRCKRCHSTKSISYKVTDVTTFKNLNKEKGEVRHTNTSSFYKNIHVCSHCGAYNYLSIYNTPIYDTIENFVEDYKLEHQVFFKLNKSDTYTLDLYYKII